MSDRQATRLVPGLLTVCVLLAPTLAGAASAASTPTRTVNTYWNITATINHVQFPFVLEPLTRTGETLTGFVSTGCTAGVTGTVEGHEITMTWTWNLECQGEVSHLTGDVHFGKHGRMSGQFTDNELGSGPFTGVQTH